MDRLRGLGSFAAITVIVLLGLRVVHVATPLVFPAARVGPIDVASLDDARRLTGFAPMLPAYRPATLGPRPVSMTVLLAPRPSLTILWREGEEYLSVTERQGGARPSPSPHSRLILERGGLWIELETNLAESELQRFADTLDVVR